MQPMAQPSFLPPTMAQPSFLPPANTVSGPYTPAPFGAPTASFGGAPMLGAGMPMPMLGGMGQPQQFGGFSGLGGGVMPQLGGAMRGGFGQFAPPQNQPISQLAMAAPGLTLPSMSMTNLPMLPGIGAPAAIGMGVPTPAQPLTSSFQPPPLPAAPMPLAQPNYYAPQATSYAPPTQAISTISYAPANQYMSTAPYMASSYAPETTMTYTQGVATSYAPESYPAATLSAAPTAYTGVPEIITYAGPSEATYTAAPQVITYATEGAAMSAPAAAPIGMAMGYPEQSLAYPPSTVYLEDQGVGGYAAAQPVYH